jgi:hypothetical protein
MSVVQISGNVSGTGTLTIAAPNTNSNYTLTLPQTTSTLGIDGPTFSAYANATQNLTTAVATKVVLQLEEWDTASAFDSTTNYRFTPAVAGYYQINAMCRVIASSAMADAWIALFKNGGVYKRATEFGNANVMTNGQIVLSEMVYLNGSTDYIELYVSISGTSPNLDGASGQAFAPRLSGFLARSA